MARRKESATGALDKDSNQSAVERQTESSHKSGTIWDAIRKADQPSLERLLDADPNSINTRGFVGECPIHMLFLYGTEAHLNMAQYLITRFPEIIIQSYNEAEYYGEIVLHIAIINRNATMVEWLLGDKRNRPYQEQQLTAAASGHFFQFGRPCYYGENPLAFACCTNQWNIAEILLKYGADLDMVDSNGNTILHLLVIHNLPKMYTKFKKHWLDQQATVTNESDDDDDKGKVVASVKEKKVPLWNRLNKDGFTPLTLAAKLGQNDMFSFLFDERKKVQWCYGPVSCVLYPLDEVDLEIQQEVIGWGYMLFFVMAFQLTGPFVVMIYEMLFNDVLRFCIIYMVFLVGFSQAFFILFNNNGFSGFFLSVKQCFFGMLGDFDIDRYTGTTFQYVSVSLLVIYVVVVSILLLNLLIAMMGDTYGNIIEGATQIWHLEQARIVFAIENEMSADERMLNENKYWTTIDGKRYLQVEEVDKDCFRDINNDNRDDDNNEKKRET
ncbi:unnamed protein product [Rotaria socialis]|uniref:Ion transport domain-containing protein n=1 Tax=Rotaria socialis TaxID=392032 RepID=A0A820AAZ4_9BILA|nr:unnamed protein product [Rotaria socialis]